MKSKLNLYFTYNPFQKRFLKDKGISYVTRGIHPYSNKQYWSYERGNILDKALTEWKEYQNNRFKNKE